MCHWFYSSKSSISFSLFIYHYFLILLLKFNLQFFIYCFSCLIHDAWCLWGCPHYLVCFFLWDHFHFGFIFIFEIILSSLCKKKLSRISIGAIWCRVPIHCVGQLIGTSLQVHWKWQHSVILREPVSMSPFRLIRNILYWIQN